MINLTRRAVLRTTGAASFLSIATSAAADPDALKTPTTIVDFDPEAGELPESLAFDPRGTAYVTLGTGEIRAFASQELETGASGETFATIAPFEPGVDLFVGITATARGTLYAVQASPTTDFDTGTIPASDGTIWRVTCTGRVQRLIDLPLDETEDAFPNDLIRRKHHKDLLVTDSLRGAIWRVTDDGTATIWLDDPLLDPDPDAPFLPVGVNGIAAASNGIYVANTTQASIVRVPVGPDGSAGTPCVVAQDERLFGADGIALDTRGTVYVAVAVGNRIALVSPEGDVAVLAETDGLAFPSAVAFGTSRGQQQTLYITNFDVLRALSLMEGEPAPGLAALYVGVPGRPPRADKK